METIKDTLLTFISPAKQVKVKPLIDQVIWFYGPNIKFQRTNDTLSRFVRNIQFNGTPRPVPLAEIYLSSNGFPEEALIHELLHLVMPLRHEVYGIGFTTDDEPLKELTSQINNVLEHDLFLPDYLSLGYTIDRFIGPSELNKNYLQRVKEGGVNQVYWLHEYLRLLISLKHLPEEKQAICRKGLENVRNISLKKYPELRPHYQNLREWINERSFHVPGQYFKSISKLHELMGITKPIKFITPRGAQTIDIIYAKDLPD